MKRAAIMQPYFFPYIGYFSLIKHTNQFILFDSVQFIRHGWIERNRVLKQDSGWLYIKVPLIKVSRDVLIKDMRIDNSQDWKPRILAQLQPYKKTAPYYSQVVDLMQSVFKDEYEDITSLNKRGLEVICAYLGIDRKIEVFSQMNLQIETPQNPDEWALNICKVLPGIAEYWNPPGGQEFFDKHKYDVAGIKLCFLQSGSVGYDQKRQPFEAGLSIIDVLMFNSIEDVHVMLDTYELT